MHRRSLTINGHDVACHTAGTGPVLLLVHGMAAHTHWWNETAPLLADRFRPVALDLRGHAFTGMPTDRDAETLLVDLCAHMPPDVTLWCEYGDPEFLAGVAVMLAGHTSYDRAAYLALAESLLPGASTLEQYEAWYQNYRPDFARLLAMVDRERRAHVRSEA